MGYFFNINFKTSEERPIALDKAINSLEKAITQTLEDPRYDHLMYERLWMTCESGRPRRTYGKPRAMLLESIKDYSFYPQAWGYSVRGEQHFVTNFGPSLLRLTYMIYQGHAPGQTESIVQWCICRSRDEFCACGPPDWQPPK